LRESCLTVFQGMIQVIIKWPKVKLLLYSNFFSSFVSQVKEQWRGFCLCDAQQNIFISDFSTSLLLHEQRIEI